MLVALYASPPITAYNIKKEAQTELLAGYGLTSHSDVKNITKAGSTIKKDDIALRREAKDNTIDYAGILRNMSLNGGDDDETAKESTGFNLELWNKTAVVLHHRLAASGREVLHYDGTGCKVHTKNDLSDGEINQHFILSINANAFVTGSECKQLGVKTKLNPKILAHFISNRTKTKDHTAFLTKFVDAEKKMFGTTFPPLLFSTDCAGELENACLRVWTPPDGKPVSKILYANATLLVLIQIEREANSPVACQTYISLLQRKCNPTLLSECKYHVLK